VKVAVIGTIMLDEIFPYEGEPRESFGGILYNVLAFAHLLGPNDMVSPICYVGQEQRAQIIEEHFREFPSIDASGMYVSPGGQDRNTLRYVSPEVREEKMTLGTPVIGFDDVRPFLDADLILINFINSRDTDLATIREIRREAKGIVAMDIHNATRRLTSDGNLILRERGFPEGLELAAQVDIVQINEEELGAVTGRIIKSPDDALRGAKTVLGYGPAYVVVTLGSAGSCLAYREGNEVYGFRVPPFQPEKMIDPTGCGDSFGATFLTGLVRGESPPLCALRASVVAGLNCEVAGLGGLKKSGEAPKRMKEAFPELLRKIEDGWPGEAL
jgi:sugar/nucleoside kinase (ribokinase family)